MAHEVDTLPRERIKQKQKKQQKTNKQTKTKELPQLMAQGTKASPSTAFLYRSRNISVLVPEWYKQLYKQDTMTYPINCIRYDASNGDISETYLCLQILWDLMDG